MDDFPIKSRIFEALPFKPSAMTTRHIALRLMPALVLMIVIISASMAGNRGTVSKPVPTEHMHTDSTADQCPTFPVDMTVFYQYVQTHFTYPTYDILGPAPRGLIKFRFFVTPQGKVHNASILHYLHPKCDRELLRVLKESPQWNNFKPSNDSIAYLYEGVAHVNPVKATVIDSVHCTYVGSQVIPLTPESIRADSIRLYQESLEIAEQMPEFPGGFPAIIEYIQKQLYSHLYDKYHVHQNQGRVLIMFTIDTEGFVRYPKIVRSTMESDADKEALRIIRELPQWIPGRHNGQAVAVHYVIPVVFRLQ